MREGMTECEREKTNRISGLDRRMVVLGLVDLLEVLLVMLPHGLLLLLLLEFLLLLPVLVFMVAGLRRRGRRGGRSLLTLRSLLLLGAWGLILAGGLLRSHEIL